ncbi:hypothetical protein [Acetivibrio straminisolvens]|uniref:Beta-lactamase n=1 Tax=Acetivibrio straminisolvens JCM 21531 TaxID=1294263 RepID=W4VAS5_9FIRM|nr:hypothetical protein [Acetivibrio straminisolvens]GAE89854.1 beta-lactamase [Acetivibrio straminisolvens JCM 21531]
MRSFAAGDYYTVTGKNKKLYYACSHIFNGCGVCYIQRQFGKYEYWKLSENKDIFEANEANYVEAYQYYDDYDIDFFEYDVDSLYVESEYLEDIGEPFYYEDLEYDFEKDIEESAEDEYAVLKSKLQKYISKFKCRFGIYLLTFIPAENSELTIQRNFLLPVLLKYL